MRAMPSFVGVLLALALNVSAPGAAAEGPIGRVTGLEGDALLTRAGSGASGLLHFAAPIHLHDRIETRADAMVELRFEDDSVVTLGADSVLRITEFVYTPRAGQRSALLDLAAGAFRAVVERVVPDSVFEVRMEQVVAAVRGTRWIGELADGTASVVALEGLVAVRRADEEVVLGAGEGVDPRPDEPLRKQRWGEPRIDALRDRTTIRRGAFSDAGRRRRTGP